MKQFPCSYLLQSMQPVIITFLSEIDNYNTDRLSEIVIMVNTFYTVLELLMVTRKVSR